MSIVPDNRGGVYPPSPIQRPARPAGIGPRPVVGRFLIADYNAEWRHRTPGELLRAAEAFWTLPPALQSAAYYRLAALACHVADQLLVLSIVDAGDGQEVA